MSGLWGSDDIKFPNPVGCKLAAIGDSITANCSSYVTPPAGNVTSVGSVMTVTVNSHLGLAGFPIIVASATQDEYNGVHSMGSGTTATVINNISFPGSVTSPATGTPVVYMPHVSADTDWLGMCSWLTGGTISRGLPLGFPGKTTSYVASKLAWVYSDDPDICVVMAGVNDMRQITGAGDIGTYVNAAYANVMSMAAALKANGILPIICTITPISNTVSGWSVSQQHGVLRLNKLLREHCANTRDMVLCDMYAATVSPVSTTGNWKTSYASDGLHPTGLGAYAMASELYSTLIALGIVARNPKLLPTSTAEDYGTNAACLQICDNPLGVNQAGTATAPATGTVWTGWTLARAGVASTVTGTVPARSDGFGYNQTVEVVSTADGDGFTLTGTNFSGRVTTGQRIFAIAEITVASATALKQLSLHCNIVAGGVAANMLAGRSSSAVLDNTNKTYTIITPIVAAPGAMNVQPIITAKFSGAGGALISVGRMAIFIVG